MSGNKQKKCPFQWTDTENGREFKDCLLEQCMAYQKKYYDALLQRDVDGFCNMKHEKRER